MQVTQTSAEGLRREFKIVVPAADIEQRIRSRLTELGREVRLPGFRPGRVPLPILKQRYGRSVMGEVLESAVNDGSRHTVSEHGLRPALQPRVEVTNFSEGTDLEFTIAVEVLPEIDPGDLSTLEIDRPVVEITDESVEEALQGLAKARPNFTDLTDPRPAQLGDQVTADFAGTVEGMDPATAPPGLSGKDYPVVLGSGQFIPGFEEQIVGASVGDHVTVSVIFPEDYPAADVAGKAASFAVDIKAIRAPVPSEVSDELGKQYGFDDVDGLRKTMRESMERNFGSISRSRAKRQLLDKLAERYHFEVPAGMLEAEFDQIWQQVQDSIKRGDADDPDTGKPEEQLREEYRAIAERRVRLGLLLAEIGRLNAIEVTPEEVKGAVAAELQRQPQHAHEIMEFYKSNPDALAALRAPILEDKVIDHILDIAQVHDHPVTREELMRDPDEERPATAASAGTEAEAAAPAGDGGEGQGEGSGQPG